MAGIKEYTKRFGTLFLALLFLITTVGFTVLVIWQIRQDNKNQAAQTEINEAVKDKTEENMLKGTKLEKFTPIEKQASELQTIDLVKGDGKTVKEGANITAHYTGAYAVNGEIFESSKDSGEPLSDYPLSGLIKGWVEGIPGMKVGGTRRLIIPGNLAYGEAPAGYTPGSTDRPLGTLVFDIEMIKVSQ